MLAYLPDEAAAVRFTQAVQEAGFPWLVDLVPAYTSVGVHFDPDQATLAKVREALAFLGDTPTNTTTGRHHCIPCCYEMHLDLERVAEHTGLSANVVIAKHTQATYTIYAIGFCPGFPYLGYLPPELCGVPRRPSPRVRLEPGSVGLTGKQTGLYPLVRPGGWNIIGRTPLTLVDVEAGYFPLQVGDTVQFQRIDAAEFQKRLGERLQTS